MSGVSEQGSEWGECVRPPLWGHCGVSGTGDWVGWCEEVALSGLNFIAMRSSHCTCTTVALL